MISPDLHALGFDFGDWDEMMDLVVTKEIPTVNNIGPYDAVGRYDDPSGAKLGLFVYEGSNPYTVVSIDGVGGYEVKAYLLHPACALLDIYIEGELYTRLIAHVDDTHCYPTYEYKASGKLAEFSNYSLGAAAVEFKLFESEAEWEQSKAQTAEGFPTGSQFVLCPSLFSLASGEIDENEVQPFAMFTGVIESVELKTNQLANANWYRAIVDCGFKVAVAIPADVAKPPVPGGVIDGVVMVLGTSGFWDQER